MEKFSTLLYLILGVMGKKCVRRGVKSCLNKWNYWRLLKYLHIWLMLFIGHSLIIIRWGWERFFSKIGKWHTPTIKYKRIAHSNSLFKLWLERKFASNLRPLESYKKDVVFLVATTLKDITNHSLKLGKAAYPISSQYLTLLQWFPVFWRQQVL